MIRPNDPDVRATFELLFSELFGFDKGQVKAIMDGYRFIDHFVVGSFASPYLMGDPRSKDPDTRFDANFRTGEATVTRDDVPFYIVVPKRGVGMAQPFPVSLWGHGVTGHADEVLQMMALRAQRADVFAGNANLNRHANRLACFQLAHVNARTGHARRQSILQRRDQMRGVVFVFHLQNDLRVIELLEFRRNRRPETRPTSADKRRQRFQHFARVVAQQHVGSEELRIGCTELRPAAAVSVAANIVEGAALGSEREFTRALRIAHGSIRELGYYINLAKRLNLVASNVETKLSVSCDETSRVLAGLIKSFQRRS